MKWRKMGLVYQPNGAQAWSQSHAQLPIVDTGEEDCWRIYFATRDSENRAHIGFVEVEPERPQHILRTSGSPVLPFGPLGSFDESGLMPVCVVRHGGRIFLYYAGWSLRRTIPYHNSIGLAVSDDGGRSFDKIGAGPVFDLLPHEPYFTGTIDVRIEDGRWRAWYQSCTGWEMIDGRPEPFYHIKYAESADGIRWERQGRIAIDYADRNEGGISSASVLRDSDIYRMWYSYRAAAGYRDNPARSYRIGCAESVDGLEWTRLDGEAGIDVSPEGWDSQMVAYPHVVRHGNALYMFYNGNGFGRSGFGYAVATMSMKEA